MASADIEEIESRSTRWRTAVRGPLPEDFLRINGISGNPAMQNQAANDYQTALAYQQHQQQQMLQYVPQNHLGRLSITCVQARLNRNYGLTRMDPFCRVRVGHYVYETQTDPSAGKNPRWNRVIQTQLANGVNSIAIEIYDECSFKMDELIAWCEIKIPDVVMRGETHEEWYALSGKMGDSLEGTINIVLSFSNQPVQQYMYRTLPAAAPLLMVPQGRPMPIFVAPQQPQVPATITAPPQLTDADYKQMHEMFPNIDREVVKSVYEANRGNKDATINSLLQMNE